jgi:alpha-N-arabinofuranosidase
MTGTEIMLAANLGTKGIEECLDELEYVNGAPGTAWADLRVRNGIPESMDISMWCLGNEMDGPWQVGHMDAQEYASHRRQGVPCDETGGIRSATRGLRLFERTHAELRPLGTHRVGDKAYEHLDFISCHAYYYDRGAASFQDFLLSSADMTHFITTVAEISSSVKARKAHES